MPSKSEPTPQRLEPLFTFPDQSRIEVWSASLFITATETGLALARLLHPDLDPLEVIDRQRIEIPLSVVSDHLPILREALSRLAEFQTLRAEAPNPAMALGPHADRVDTIIAMDKLREMSPPEEVETIGVKGGSDLEADLQSGRLSRLLQDLVEAGYRKPGIPQRKSLPDDLRVDYLLQANGTDLPDHKLQVSKTEAFPTTTEWELILAAWPWQVEHTPRPRRVESPERYYLTVDLPNPIRE